MKNAVRTYGRKRIWAIIVALMATLLPATAQDYRFEAGGGLGISGYLGDVNQSNVLKNPGFSGELLFRYLINKRFALKTSLATASISGNSADFKNVYPNNAQYAFDAQYYDAAVAFEFNFINFGMNTDYRNLKRLVPYLSLGLGASYSSCSAFAVNIPISAGAKFKLTNRWNLGLEMRARMMLGDKIDGLSDLYNVKSSFMKNTDWCPTLMVSISYEFGEICKICHYVE